MKYNSILFITLIGLLTFSCQNNIEEPKKEAPKAENSLDDIKKLFDTDVPDKILTPNSVDTRIGKLDCFDGLPSDATVDKVYENLDFMRGVECFLSGIPATSIEGMRIGMKEMGCFQARIKY